MTTIHTTRTRTIVTDHQVACRFTKVNVGSDMVEIPVLYEQRNGRWFPLGVLPKDVTEHVTIEGETFLIGHHGEIEHTYHLTEYALSRYFLNKERFKVTPSQWAAQELRRIRDLETTMVAVGATQGVAQPKELPLPATKTEKPAKAAKPKAAKTPKAEKPAATSKTPKVSSKASKMPRRSVRRSNTTTDGDPARKPSARTRTTRKSAEKVVAESVSA